MHVQQTFLLICTLPLPFTHCLSTLLKNEITFTFSVICYFHCHISIAEATLEVCLGPCQISVINFFAETVKGSS